MPFEFTGAPPTFAGADQGLNPFASHPPLAATPQSDNKSSNPTSPLRRPGFGGSISFGTTATGVQPSYGTPPTATSGQPQVASLSGSFGAPATSGETSPWAASSLSQSAPLTNSPSTTEPNAKLTTDASKDILQRALERAVAQRPAVFGAADTGADATLREWSKQLIEGDDVAKFATLTKQLGSIAEMHPQAMDFVRSLFDKAAKMDRPKVVTRSAKKQEAQTKASQAPTLNNKEAREALILRIHNKLVEIGFRENAHHTDGRLYDDHARILCHVALSSETREALESNVREELYGNSLKSPVLPAFIDWLWFEVQIVLSSAQEGSDVDDGSDVGNGSDAEDDDAEETERSSRVPTETANKGRIFDERPIGNPQLNPLDAFLPRAGFEERMAAIKQRNRTYYPWDGPTPKSALRCCVRWSVSMVKEAPKECDLEVKSLIEDADVESFRKWLKKQLPFRAEADAVAEAVIRLLKNHGKDDLVTDSCLKTIRKVVEGSEYFVEDALQVLFTRTFVEPEQLPAPLRIMDLPPELRNRIYRAALVPGEIRLLSCKHYEPLGVTPTPTLNLLAVCRQINDEAKGLLFENTFLADGRAEERTSTGLMFRAGLLPRHICSKITSLTITLSLAQASTNWQEIRSMTSLKTLKLCFIESLLQPFTDADWHTLITDLMEIIPTACSVSFEARTATEKLHCEEMKKRLGPKAYFSQVDRPLVEMAQTKANKKVIKG